jgi:hypothetical protein
MNNELEKNIEDIDYYKLYLGNKQYVSFNKGFRENNCDWKYWHEVVIDED